MKKSLKKIYNYGNDIFGLPQQYKGVDLYPIKVKDLKYQDIFYSNFCQPKKYIPDKEILKSSYLKFFIYVFIPNSKMDTKLLYSQFIDFLSYIFKKEVSILYKQGDGEGLSSIDLGIRIGDIELTENDFDNMREIILEQNGLSIEYIEEYHPDLEKKLSFLNRSNESLTLQDEIFTFCSLMKISVNDIKDYSVLQFRNHFEKLINLKEFDLYKPLLVSGQIELKSGEVKHYLYHSKKSGRYDSIMTNLEDFTKDEAFKALQNK